MNEIFMTIGQRCDSANILPTMGTLQAMTEAKALKRAFVEGFGKAQIEAYEITKDEMGQYHTTDAKKDTNTKVTLSDEEVRYFKNMISSLSAKKMVTIDNVDLYNKVMAIELPDNATTDEA